MKLLPLLFLLTACDKTPEKPAEPEKAAAAPGEVPAPADVAAPPADATKTASGLAYKILTPGTGTETPAEWDKVTVNYTGWTTDGKMFDSSTKRGKPATFDVKRVIPGWTEGLQLMTKGEKVRFWIPKELAYKGQPGKPEGMLVFDVELVDFKAAPKPPPAPTDVAAAPADATKTASGLAYKVLQPGTGTEHPGAADRVTVNYTGWTTDGKMFDSSVPRGAPAAFGLDQVIPGWTEGMQLMTVGEKVRFWIPKELAYNDQPNKPAGMLVFDVELVDFKKAPPVPADVAAPSKGAKKTASGLAYKVLQKGTGKDHPTATSRVTVNYTGWTKEGKMFDSSVLRGKPASFALGQVIPGWTEGVQLMVVGEKTRFWIPANIAYGDTPKRPGAPSGQLTFEIELVSIDGDGAMPPHPVTLGGGGGPTAPRVPSAPAGAPPTPTAPPTQK